IFNFGPGGGTTFTFPADFQSYEGMHLLYQDFSVPTTTSKLSVSFSLAWNSAATFTDTSVNPNLDYTTPKANQQIRVDLIDPTGAPLINDVKPASQGGSVLQTLFVTT